MSEQILQNQVRCNKCGDEPYSAYRRDFKYCKCGSVAVDGGMSYLRRAGDLSDVTDLSITVPQKVYYDCLDALRWAKDTGRNELGTICALFRVLRDNGYDLNNRSNEDD
jgi:hypothetical protein